MLRITCEHTHTNMHSNKDFQSSSLVLFSSKKLTKPDFISPFSSRCSAKRFFFFCLVYFIDTTEFVMTNFLTNVCHKHDVFLHKNKKNALSLCICCLKYVWGELTPAPGRTCPDMTQVCPCLGRSTKSQIWILACNSFGIC